MEIFPDAQGSGNSYSFLEHKVPSSFGHIQDIFTIDNETVKVRRMGVLSKSCGTLHSLFSSFT